MALPGFFLNLAAMKKILLLAAVLLWLGASAQEVTIRRGHPRLLMLAGEERAVREKIAANPFLEQAHDHIIARCEQMLSAPDPVRELSGADQLLRVSRQVFEQVYYLGYGYRMSGDERFARRAEEVMLAACTFEDWNPAHFLDVAEMTMALAIGYDWLYNRLPASSRRTIREAILHKGIEESLPETATHEGGTSWLEKRNNWNAVCNTGMSFGALATWEEHPELSERVVRRAIDLVGDVAMEEYEPDGAYPEGYTYWMYGTGFAAMLIDGLESAAGSSFGLADHPGFLRTPAYMLAMTTASLDCFRYSDCNSDLGEVRFALPMFWFARRSGDCSLLWREMEKVDYMNAHGSARSMLDFRYLPALMGWAPDRITRNEAPSWTSFVGRGTTPVALLRNRWSGDDEVFVGVKGGDMKTNHSHMDLGSFVMSVGKRDWVIDLGSQSYESIEAAGVRLQPRRQNATRWVPFRWSPLSHNIVTFGDVEQRVGVKLGIDSVAPTAVYCDLSKVDAAAVEAHTRGVAILADGSVEITDTLLAGDRSTPLRWAMLTPAEVTITSPQSAALELDGGRLAMCVEGDGATMNTWPTNGYHDYDAPNPGVMVGFTATLAPGQRAVYRVVLSPVR